MFKTIGVGDNFVDRYVNDRLMYPGGNSVNFSIYCRMLGYESAYLGVLGQDYETGMIQRALEHYGVSYDRCVVAPGGETGKGSIRLVNGDRIITDDNDNGAVKKTPLQLTDALLSYISGFDAIHTACYGFLDDQLPKLKSTGVPVCYDFSDSWAEDTIRAFCPYITIAFFSSKDYTKEELKPFLQLACAFGCEVAIATLGKDGAIVYDGTVFRTLLPYRSDRPIVDTMGAGDSFLTGFVTTYLSGMKRVRGLEAELGRSFLGEADKTQYRAALIESSMQTANAMAMKTCMTHGSFGIFERYDPKDD